jgi:hypothetical protein
MVFINLFRVQRLQKYYSSWVVQIGPQLDADKELILQSLRALLTANLPPATSSVASQVTRPRPIAFATVLNSVEQCKKLQ